MPPKIILYIAQSIDGYIAKTDGSLDWLEQHPNPEKLDYGYYSFYNSISSTIMGNATYQEILGFGVDWPYPNCKSYIVSKNTQLEIKTPNTFLLNDLNLQTIDKIKVESQKNIWLIGGGKLIKSFLELKAIDEMIITTIPVLLGDGIPLFERGFKPQNFNLKHTQSFSNGVINIHYEK